MGGFWRSPTSEEEGKFTGLVQEVYENFVNVVASGRGMDADRVRELATGEIFTGKGAQQTGLVDELGDFDTALELAAGLGETRRRPIWVRKRRPLLERLVGGRIGGPGAAEGIVTKLEGLLMGGLYFIAPQYLPGLDEGDL